MDRKRAVESLCAKVSMRMKRDQLLDTIWKEESVGDGKDGGVVCVSSVIRAPILMAQRLGSKGIRQNIRRDWK